MGFRVDKGQLGSSRIDHNGNLIVTGALTRTGVFSYKHIDGSVSRELRHPKDVFAPEAIASLIQMPVTDEHPDEGRTTPENVGRYMVGNVGDTIKRDGTFVKADVIIRKKVTIEKVRGDGTKPKHLRSIPHLYHLSARLLLRIRPNQHSCSIVFCLLLNSLQQTHRGALHNLHRLSFRTRMGSRSAKRASLCCLSKLSRNAP